MALSGEQIEDLLWLGASFARALRQANREQNEKIVELQQELLGAGSDMVTDETDAPVDERLEKVMDDVTERLAAAGLGDIVGAEGGLGAALATAPGTQQARRLAEALVAEQGEPEDEDQTEEPS